jgi:hypothetical protein
MNRIFTLAGVALAALFVGVAGMGMTATTAKAQSAIRPTDVRVINTTAQPVPTTLQGTNVVNVGNSPSVNVSNTPNVAVTSLPAVQIGNDNTAPVPVNVVNQPAAANAGQYVAFQVFVEIADNATSGSTYPGYTVPAGKILIIEGLSGAVTAEAGAKHSFSLQTVNSSGSGMNYLFNADGIFYGSSTPTEIFERKVTAYSFPGGIGFYVGRDRTVGTSGDRYSVASINVWGRLIDNPASAPSP